MADTRNLGVMVNDEATDETRTLAAGEEALDGDGKVLPTVTRAAADPLVTDVRPGGHWWFNTVSHQMWWSHGGGDWTRIGEYAPPTDTLYEAFPEFEDTFSAAPGWSGGPWVLAVNKGTATITAPPSGATGRNQVFGVLDMASGGQAAAWVGITLSPVIMRFEGGLWSLWARALLPALSTAGQAFRARFGFIDNNSGAPVDGAFFEYNGPTQLNWRAGTVSASTFTYADSGVVAAANNWYDFQIIIDPSVPTAKFYINDVLRASITTNIPLVAGRETSIGIRVEKTVGATSQSLYVDRIYMKRGAT
jgi:hypothetical protein